MQCDSPPPEERTQYLAWWIYWSHSQFLFSPHGIQVSLEISRDLLFVSRCKKKKTSADTWVTAEVFNINSLSSRTQLGHLYLTHSIGVRWICISGVLECASAQERRWNHGTVTACSKRQSDWLLFTIQSGSCNEAQAVRKQQCNYKKWHYLFPNWQRFYYVEELQLDRIK